MPLCLHGPRCAFDQRGCWYMHLGASVCQGVYLCLPFLLPPSLHLVPLWPACLFLCSSLLPFFPPPSPRNSRWETTSRLSFPLSSPLLPSFLSSFPTFFPPARPPLTKFMRAIGNFTLHMRCRRNQKRHAHRHTYIHIHRHTKQKRELGLETFLSAHKHRRTIRRTNAFIRASRTPLLNKHYKFVLGFSFFLSTVVSC